MPLELCPECHKEKSDQAKACPHCGYRGKKKRPFSSFRYKSVVFISVAVIVLASIGFFAFTYISITPLMQEINDIGEVSNDSVGKISVIEEKYNSLPAFKQLLVFNRSTLLNARATYDQIRANMADTLIGEIGVVSQTSEAKLLKAEEFWASLSERQRGLAKESDTLLKARV